MNGSKIPRQVIRRPEVTEALADNRAQRPRALRQSFAYPITDSVGSPAAAESAFFSWVKRPRLSSPVVSRPVLRCGSWPAADLPYRIGSGYGVALS